MLRHVLASFLFGIGILALSWLGWAIRGPYPFSHIGGGPWMLFVTAVSLLITVHCVTAAIILHRTALRSAGTPR